MMKNQLKYSALTLISFLSINGPILPGTGSSGIFLLPDIERLLQGNFEQEMPIPEVQDPAILAKMDKLAICESNNREDVVIIDTNGYRSYGKFQFQLATFRAFAEKYELITKGLTNDELRPLLLDGELQSNLVYEMLENEPESISAWRNCANKHGLWN